MSTIGTRIRALREERDLKQTELAKALGITSAAISAYELGKSTPRRDLLQKIARYFSVSVDWLLGLSTAAVRYQDLLSSYIAESGMSLEEVAQACRERGLQMPSKYLGELMDGTRPAPSDETASRIIAEVTGGDADRLTLAASLEHAPQQIRDALSGIDLSLLTLIRKVSGKSYADLFSSLIEHRQGRSLYEIMGTWSERIRGFWAQRPSVAEVKASGQFPELDQYDAQTLDQLLDILYWDVQTFVDTVYKDTIEHWRQAAFGQRMEAAKKLYGLDLRSLKWAPNHGITSEDLAAWESGETEPSTEQLSTVAALLQGVINFLVAGEADISTPALDLVLHRARRKMQLPAGYIARMDELSGKLSSDGWRSLLEFMEFLAKRDIPAESEGAKQE